MWRCGCLSMCPMCSTPLWEPVAGSTLTCSRNCGSRSCTTLPFCGRRASAAPHRLSFRVSCLDGQIITLFLSEIHNIHNKSSRNKGFRCDPVCFLRYFLAGALYPTSMRINDQGRLVVNFRTKARFRGLFVELYSGGRIKRAGKTDFNSIVIIIALCQSAKMYLHLVKSFTKQPPCHPWWWVWITPA